MQIKINDSTYDLELDIKVDIKLRPMQSYGNRVDGFVMDAINANLSIYGYEIAKKIEKDVLGKLNEGR